MIRASQVNDLINRINDDGTFDFANYKVCLSDGSFPNSQYNPEIALLDTITQHFKEKYPPGKYPSDEFPFERELIPAIPKECK